MRVWLIKNGEELPLEASASRPMRMGLVAQELTRRGHEVVWWSSTFSHHQKRFIANKDSSVKLSESLTVELVHAGGYKGHVSIKRLIHHIVLGIKLFYKMRSYKTRPDLILSAVPALETSFAAQLYAQTSIPTIVDARDMWPDIFKRAFPKKLQVFSPLFLWPYRLAAKFIFSKATAIFGVSEAFVKWGLSYTKRLRNSTDRSFPLAYPMPQKELSTAPTKIFNLLEKQKGKLILSFTGTFNRNFDFGPIRRAAEVLEQKRSPVHFFLCGEGDQKKLVQKLFEGCSNVSFLPWLNKQELEQLLSVTHIGLAPYVPKEDFSMNYPNKIIEYLAYGIFTLTSLEGLSRELVERNKIGAHYPINSNQAALFAIEVILENSEHLREARIRAFEIFQSDFLSPKVYGAYVDQMESIAGRYPSSKNFAIHLDSPKSIVNPSPSLEKHKRDTQRAHEQIHTIFDSQPT
jgi:glycosyltransferase involved in cell wall biosynthesis